MQLTETTLNRTSLQLELPFLFGSFNMTSTIFIAAWALHSPNLN